MSKSKYEKTISKIKTTEEFRNETINRLKLSLIDKKINSKKARYDYRKFGTVAACFIFLVTIGLAISYFKGYRNGGNQCNYVDEKDNVTIDKGQFVNLPKLTVTTEIGGMGFEGLCGYSIEDIDNGNPWTVHNDIKTLPVFKNKAPLIGAIIEANLSAPEMTSKAKEIAKIMGKEIKEIAMYPTEADMKAMEEKNGHEEDSRILEVTAFCDGVEIIVETDGSVRIKFEPGVALPDKYNFTFTNTNRDEAKEAVDYLAKKYGYIINMKKPSLKISGNYSFNGELLNNYDIYEGDGDLKNNIINYNFNNVSFVPNDNGELWLIDINKIDISDKVGDYPIITVDEAKELLSAGNYFSSAPEKYSEDNAIEKVELVYRTSAYDKVFMPYYKFWTELPSYKDENGLKTYVAYYVPAVEEQYIENMPKIEFRFN